MASSTWEVVETEVRGRVMITVSMREGQRDGAPLYSAQIGTTQVLNDGTTRISKHMSVYDLPDAVVLLQKMGEKYQLERESYRDNPGISRRYREARRT
jgi:hypothetical protein